MSNYLAAPVYRVFSVGVDCSEIFGKYTLFPLQSTLTSSRHE